MGAFAEDLGLKSIKRKLPRLPQTIADHYRLGMQEVAKKMLEALGIKQKISITSTEDLLSNVMDTTLRILARSVEHKHGHTVRLLNNLTGGKVDTQSIFESSLGNRTLAEACSREFHASGAVIYQAFYTHSIRKSFVALVYDGNKGGIHKIAIEYMNEHGLWICPVGACEIYPRNAPKFHHLDPWVFLELLERWGKNKAHEYLKGIWDLLEVPLPSGNIGKKTKILVDLDGIKVLTD